MARLAESSGTFLRDLWADKHRLAFVFAYLVSWGGTITTCGGLAALLVYCQDNYPQGLGAGFKLQKPYTGFAFAIMEDQRMIVSDPHDEGAFQCSKFFRFDWFLWSFQVTWLLILSLCWWRRTLGTYMAGLWAMGATVTAWHYFKIDYIISMEQWTQGDVHTDGIITSGGLIFTCIGNLLLFLVGSPYCQRGDGPPRRNGRSDVGSDAYDSNKNGSFDSPPTPIQSTSGATGAFNNV